MREDSSGTPSSPRVSVRKQYVSDFAGYTTFHGLHFVFEPHGTARRLIWLILILTGLGFCTNQLFVSYKRLKAHDHVITKEIIPLDKLTFPAVTFCNVNMMRKSKIQGTDAQLYLDQINVLKKKYLPQELANNTFNSSFDIEKAVLKYGHTASNMVITCSWNGELCSHNNMSTSFSQLFGLCHTFNPGKHGHSLLSSTSIKKTHGLVMLLYIDYLDYYGINSYFNTGLKLVIHDQNEVPRVELKGWDVMPSQTFLTVQRKEYVSLPPPYKSACGSKKLETSNFYTRSVCLQECHTRKIIKQCGCKLLGMPDLQEFNGTKYCDPKTMVKCGLLLDVSRYMGISEQSLLTKYKVKLGDAFSSNNPEKDCDCPKPCEEVKYEIIQMHSIDGLSDSYWNESYEMQAAYLQTEAQKHALKLQTLTKKNKFRRDYVALTIHYESLRTYKTAERRAYDFHDFGSDVGGYLSLFFGCSILTVFEILDFLLHLCYSEQKAKKEVNTVFEVNISPESRI